MARKWNENLVLSVQLDLKKKEKIKKLRVKIINPRVCKSWRDSYCFISKVKLFKSAVAKQVEMEQLMTTVSMKEVVLHIIPWTTIGKRA